MYHFNFLQELNEIGTIIISIQQILEGGQRRPSNLSHVPSKCWCYDLKLVLVTPKPVLHLS